MKKILYATDFSKNADKAFNFALKIAEKHHAELIMLHVFNVPPVFGHTYSTIGPAEMKRQAAASWETYMQDFFEQFKTDIQPKFIALENPSIVKGIPTNADYSDFNNVIYASDFREVDIDALELLIELVKPYQPEIRLVHVSSENEYNAHQKMEWFKDLVKGNISYKHISFELLLSERVYERLSNYVQNHDLDMLVMLEKERSRLVDKLFHEDLVWKMEFHTTIPILSYNEHYLRATGDQDIKKGDTVKQ